MIRPYLRDLINDHRTPMKLPTKVIDESKFGEWKNQLIMLNNCISSKNFEEICSIYSASTPIEIFMGSDTDDIIDELFKTFLEKFQEARETPSNSESEFTHEKVYSIVILIKWT